MPSFQQPESGLAPSGERRWIFVGIAILGMAALGCQADVRAFRTERKVELPGRTATEVVHDTRYIFRLPGRVGRQADAAALRSEWSRAEALWAQLSGCEAANNAAVAAAMQRQIGRAHKHLSLALRDCPDQPVVQANARILLSEGVTVVAPGLRGAKSD